MHYNISPYGAALRLGPWFLSQHVGWKPYGLTFWGRVENLDSTDPLKVATPLAQALCKGMKAYDPEVTKSNQTEFWQKMKSFAPEVQHLIMLKSRQKMKPIVFKVQHLLIYPRWVFNLGCSTRFSSQTPSLNTWGAKVWAKKKWNDEKPTPPLFLKMKNQGTKH